MRHLQQLCEKTPDGRPGPILLIANKCDKEPMLHRPRVLTGATVADFAARVGVPFVETSAKDAFGVADAFAALASLLAAQHPETCACPRCTPSFQLTPVYYLMPCMNGFCLVWQEVESKKCCK